MKNILSTSRRGLTLVELLLASAVTAMVALAVASMMTSVSTVASSDRENRSAMLRAHTVREALRAYIEPSLAAVEVSPDGSSVVIWLEDDLSPGLANLLELRLIRFDSATEEIVAERVTLPAAWHPVQRQVTNALVTASSNATALFAAFRAGGMTEEVVIASGIASVEWETSDASPRNSPRIRVEVELSPADPAVATPTPMLAAFGLSDFRSPLR